jgi:hypothetical protein
MKDKQIEAEYEPIIPNGPTPIKVGVRAVIAINSATGRWDNNTVHPEDGTFLGKINVVFTAPKLPRTSITPEISQVTILP